MQSPALDPSTLPLRDIHLPENIGWWPPAPGWWLLPVLAALALATAWYARRLHQRRRYSVVNMAKRELAGIRSRYDIDRDAVHCVRAVSALLRRVSISLFPRAASAGLTGADWLAFLRSGNIQQETGKEGSIFDRHAEQGLPGIRTHADEAAYPQQATKDDEHPAGGVIPENIHTLLLEAPYRRQVAAADVEALLGFCSDWLDRRSRSKPCPGRLCRSK